MHPTTLTYKPPDPEVVGLIRDLGGHRSEIVMILRTLHTEHGQLTPHLVAEVARELDCRLPRSTGSPRSIPCDDTGATEKTIRICDGPYCMMRGAGELLSQIQAQLGELDDYADQLSGAL